MKILSVSSPRSPRPGLPFNPQPPQPNLPRLDLLEGRTGDFLNVCAPLYDALITADWPAAKVIIYQRPVLVFFAINESCETPLHVAVSGKGSPQRTTFVRNLIDLMQERALELQDEHSNMALCSAAMAGNVELAQLIVERNIFLVAIPDSKGRLPMCLAAKFGKHDMVRFLYDISSRCGSNYDWTSQHWAKILVECINSDMFDVALNIVANIEVFCSNFDGYLLSNLSTFHSILYALAQKTAVFQKRKQTLISRIVNKFESLTNMKAGPVDKHSDAMKVLRNIWGRIHGLRMEKNDIDHILTGPKKVNYRGDYSNILFVAAELGNTAFVLELIRCYPDLICKRNDENLTIIHIAVEKRHAGIYNLIHKIGSKKNRIILLEDRNGNNMLHLVGKSIKDEDEMTRRPLKIVQDYQWYKEVEMLLPPVYREKRNAAGYTPHQLFSRSNQRAWFESLMWADYGLVVATLVLGSSFAATFSVPGGFDQDSRFPIFINEPRFSVYAVADTIAFLASLISVIAFLSVVIFGRVLKEKFLDSLPFAMILGLTALLVSLMAMTVALSASLVMLYSNSLIWIISPILACFALIFFPFLYKQFPLGMDLVLLLSSSELKKHH